MFDTFDTQIHPEELEWFYEFVQWYEGLFKENDAESRRGFSPAP